MAQNEDVVADDCDRSPIMYYDPYEQCPERPTIESAEPSELSSPVCQPTAGSAAAAAATSPTESINDAAENPEPVTPEDDKYSEHTLKPEMLKGQQFSTSQYLEVSSTPTTTNERLATVERLVPVKSSQMMMTANSAYQPPTDYANMAEIRREATEEDDDDDDFHEAYMDLEPGEPDIPNIDFSAGSTDCRPMPIPAPRQHKSVTVSDCKSDALNVELPPVDPGIYEEPWDLMHRRLEFEERMNAISLTAAQSPHATRERMPSHRLKYDHTLCENLGLQQVCNIESGCQTDITCTSERCSKLQHEITGSIRVNQKLGSTSRQHIKPPHVQSASDNGRGEHDKIHNTGDDRYGMVFCPHTEQYGLSDDQKLQKRLVADNRTVNGYDKPWDLQPHCRDDRGPEGYDKPWDLKPHLKVYSL